MRKKIKKVLEDRKNVVLLVMGILCLAIVIGGIAYAYIAYYTSQKEINVLESSCIKIEYKDITEAIQLTEVYPMNEEAGEKTKPYRFSIKNVCNVGVDYDIQLEVLEEANRMASKNIAIKIDNEAKELLTEEKKVNPIETEEYEAVEAYKVYRGKLDPKETKEHSVRIWLDESAGNESQNKVFHSKIAINAVQNQIAEINFSEYIMKQEGIEKIDHEETEQTPSLTDYRYTGANPNNYVYFGCEEECTEENLYRIIGVLPTQSTEGGEYKNRVKLIKANSWGETYKWSNVSTNNWSNSSLKEILTNEYWNTLGEYQKYIGVSVWHLGAVFTPDSGFSTSPIDQIYSEERGIAKGLSGGETSFIGNVGLMYPSDYGYSIGISYRSQSVYSHPSFYKDSSWLSGQQFSEWTISPVINPYSVQVWEISHTSGNMRVNSPSASSQIMRPTFYLKEEVMYKNGEGSKENPYRIRIEEQEKIDNFSNYIIAKSETESSIEKVSHGETELTGTYALIDYRYNGANPNNYVYFGCSDNCTEDNLYRIVGVMPTQKEISGTFENRVKLIKANYYTETESGLLSSSGAAPGGKGYNKYSDATTWASSQLKTKVFDEVYWNSLGNYQNYIEQVIWYMGSTGGGITFSGKPEELFQKERGGIKTQYNDRLFVVGNIGLMYPSDYAYSIENSYYNVAMSGKNYVSNAWLYKLEEKYHEWVMTPTASSYNMWLYPTGDVYSGYPYSSQSGIFGVRPTFYLKTDVQYQSGDGSRENPYRLSIS